MFGTLTEDFILNIESTFGIYRLEYNTICDLTLLKHMTITPDVPCLVSLKTQLQSSWTRTAVVAWLVTLVTHHLPFVRLSSSFA